MRAFLCLVEPGRRVLDLGSHLGTFSLPAAAVGADVLSVDAASEHVALLREAARRNGFSSLRVAHGALAEGGAAVPFLKRSIHGRVWRAVDPPAPTVEVPILVIDDLLDEVGWDAVDVIKLDIEGGEVAALDGMRRMFARGARPSLVFECNALTLPLFGASVRQLRQMVVDLGYELLLIDHLRPGTLVQMLPDGIQPEAASDVLAVVAGTQLGAGAWHVEPPFSRERLVMRLADSAASPSAGYRSYAAEVLEAGPDWLRSDPLAAPLRRALELDVSPEVRSACRPPAEAPAREHADTADPGQHSAHDDIVALALGISVRAPGTGPERAASDAPAFDELAVTDVSLHVRAGEVLAVLAEDEPGIHSLMRALAGLERPCAGELHLGGRSILVSAPEQILEPRLTLAENAMLYGSFLGCHVRDVHEAMPAIMAHAGLGRVSHRQLSELSDDGAVRLALAVALVVVEARLIILHGLRRLVDRSVRDRISELLSARLNAGAAVVHAVTDPTELLVPAGRTLWVDGGRLLAGGHSESIFAAVNRVHTVVEVGDHMGGPVAFTEAPA
jgi:FkbM family methyltransferase